MDLLSTQLPKIYANHKTKIKQISQLHLPINMTNSNSYCFSQHINVHKFIGDQIVV